MLCFSKSSIFAADNQLKNKNMKEEIINNLDFSEEVRKSQKARHASVRRNG